MSWDKVWEEIFTSRSSWGSYPSETLIRFMAQNFSNKKKEDVRVLELGCGPGGNIWFLAREGYNTFGIDGSPTAIKQAQLKLTNNSLKASLIIGDITKINYPDDYFDCILDIECLYSNSWESTKHILQEAKRVLKKDGLLFSRTFSTKMELGEGYKTLGHHEYTDIKSGPFKAAGLTRLMDKHDIENLYGSLFNIHSIDRFEYEVNNGQSLVSEWLIVCGQ